MHDFSSFSRSRINPVCFGRLKTLGPFQFLSVFKDNNFESEKKVLTVLEDDLDGFRGHIYWGLTFVITLCDVGAEIQE
jgi:hypothetical protein